MASTAPAATAAKKVRLGYIDIAKGVAMLCIIAGHFGIASVDRVVYTFHVPLFFLVSGYFLSTRLDIRTFIMQKARQLLVPYVCAGLGIMLSAALINLAMGSTLHAIGEDTLRILGALIYGAGSAHTEPFAIRQIGLLWFLLGLFFSMIMVRLALRTKYPLVIVCALFYVGWKTAQYMWLPFSLQAACTASLFVYLGYWAKQHDLLSVKPHVLAVAALMVLWLFCIYEKISIGLVASDLGAGGLLSVIDALGASYLVVLACKQVEKRLHVLARGLNFVGQTTLIIMCFHAIADFTFPNYLLYAFLGDTLGLMRPFCHIVVVGLNIAWPIFGVFLTYHIPPLKKLFQARPVVPLAPAESSGGSEGSFADER